MAKTATLLKVGTSGSGAHYGVYRLSEPLEGYSFVRVSAATVAYSGPETYIFGCSTASGDVDDWGELEGSYRGGLDRAKALSDAGYEVVS